jgi:hypothetical protein
LVIAGPIGLSLPLLDRGQAFDGFIFVPHDGIFGKALGQRFPIPPILRGDVDGGGKIDRHMGSFGQFVLVS